jgi:hypothetical protein
MNPIYFKEQDRINELVKAQNLFQTIPLHHHVAELAQPNSFNERKKRLNSPY